MASTRPGGVAARDQFRTTRCGCGAGHGRDHVVSAAVRGSSEAGRRRSRRARPRGARRRPGRRTAMCHSDDRDPVATEGQLVGWASTSSIARCQHAGWWRSPIPQNVNPVPLLAVAHDHGFLAGDCSTFTFERPTLLCARCSGTIAWRPLLDRLPRTAAWRSMRSPRLGVSAATVPPPTDASRQGLLVRTVRSARPASLTTCRALQTDRTTAANRHRPRRRQLVPPAPRWPSTVATTTESGPRARNRQHRYAVAVALAVAAAGPATVVTNALNIASSGSTARGHRVVTRRGPRAVYELVGTWHLVLDRSCRRGRVRRGRQYRSIRGLHPPRGRAAGKRGHAATPRGRRRGDAPKAQRPRLPPASAASTRSTSSSPTRAPAEMSTRSRSPGSSRGRPGA